MALVNAAYWDNISATPADMTLGEGLYGLTLRATSWDNVVLQRILSNGTLAVITPQPLTQDSYVAPLYLPAGKYRLVLDNTTGLSGSIERIALRVN